MSLRGLRGGDSPPASPLLGALLATAVQHPVRVIATWLLLLAVAGFGVARLRIDTTTDSVLDRSDPAWNYYQESLETFGGDEVVTVALPSSTAFDPRTLAAVISLSAELEELPGVRRVDSLATVPLVRVAGDGAVDLSSALDAGVPRSQRERREFGAMVMSDRIARGSLVSHDGRVVALNVWLDSDGGTPVHEVLAGIRAAVEAPAVWVSGVPVYREEVNTRLSREILTFVPITLATIAVLLYLAFGTLRAVAMPLAVSAAGTWLAVGVMGAVGRPFTLSTMILPTVLLALGCAYAMHLLTAARAVTSRSELQARLAPVMRPVALSGLTTTIGFLALAAVRIQAVQELGTLGGVGVLCVSGAVLSLGPAVLALWPLHREAPHVERFLLSRFQPRLLGWASRSGIAILAGWVVFLVAFSTGLPRIVVNNDVTRWFPPGSEVRDDYDAIRERLAGISPMNVVIEAPTGRSVVEPAVVKAIDELTAYLETLFGVGRALSFTDPLRQLHASFMSVGATEHGIDALPASAAAISQYLLLLDGVELMEDVLTFDRDRASIVILANENGSRELMEVARLAEAWWAEHGVPEFRARTTGIMFEFARSADEIAFGQVRGLTLAFAGIGLVLALIFRWPALVIAALIPNAVPLVVVFGFMGFAGVRLDAGMVTLGTLGLGIAVDDTIHVIEAFRDERSRLDDPMRALDAGFRRVLPPLFYTSIAVSVGFAVLALSGFTVVRSLGVITPAMIMLCFVADVTLLPSLLLRLRVTRT
jgi:predicted RND superfamily exporter protein